MARATTGGRSPVGGRRRSCRRLLPTLIVLCAILGAWVPVRAASGSDAWMSARQVHVARAAAIGAAAQELTDGVDEAELEDLRRLVAGAVIAMDRLEVHDCFRVWWSYVRTSYVLYDQALVGLGAGDLARVQVATAASSFLSSMASSTAVDCSRERSLASSRPGPSASGGHPMA